MAIRVLADDSSIHEFPDKFFGLFSNSIPDLVRLPWLPLDTYEVKAAGNDEAARKQLAGYIKSAQGIAVPGNQNLVFQGGPLSADSDGFFKGAHYDYYPGRYPGTILYTMRGQPLPCYHSIHCRQIATICVWL